MVLGMFLPTRDARAYLQERRDDELELEDLDELDVERGLRRLGPARAVRECASRLEREPPLALASPLLPLLGVRCRERELRSDRTSSHGPSPVDAQ